MLRKSEYRDMERFKRTKREQQKRYYRKTQNAPNRNKRWTEEETAMIMNVRDMTDTELSRILGRSLTDLHTNRWQVSGQKDIT